MKKKLEVPNLLTAPISSIENQTMRQRTFITLERKALFQLTEEVFLSLTYTTLNSMQTDLTPQKTGRFYLKKYK